MQKILDYEADRQEVQLLPLHAGPGSGTLRHQASAGAAAAATSMWQLHRTAISIHATSLSAMADWKMGNVDDGTFDQCK